MIYKEIALKDIEPKLGESDAKLRIYISERNESVSLRPGMLVCPGGAYYFCSPREAEIIAFRFLSEGFNCFVLNYTTQKKYPTPHIDLAVAIAYIRNHEEEFDLLPNSLSTIGFSAGGHLVGSYSYLYEELAGILSYDKSVLKPLTVVMAYPVTLMDEHGEKQTKGFICDGDKALMEKLNIPSHITKDYPPTYIWATKDDQLVESINSILLDKSLTEHKVHHKCQIFGSGPHGLSLSNRACYAKEEMNDTMARTRDWASDVSDFIFDILDKR